MKFFIAACFLFGLALALPTDFDARQKWSNCAFAILDQQQCGSCWDFCSTESYSDRLCITGEAASDIIVSPEPILECSKQGCDGGFPSTAWNYMIKNGDTTCTNACKRGCAPYDSGNGKTPKCHDGTCDSGDNYPTTFYAASYKSLSSLRNHDLELYQTELYNNGPLQACFTVYNNFYSFFSLHPKGIYTETSGANVGGHCVKMVGWGTEDGQDYWLFANSWNTNWGDAGFFRMARGNNLAGIEGSVSEGFTKAQQSLLKEPHGVHVNHTREMLVGGWTPQTDLTSELVTEAVEAGVKKLGEKFQRSFLVEEVVAAETQVVAGVNYKIAVKIAEKVVAMRLHKTLSAEFHLIDHNY